MRITNLTAAIWVVALPLFLVDAWFSDPGWGRAWNVAGSVLGLWVLISWIEQRWTRA